MTTAHRERIKLRPVLSAYESLVSSGSIEQDTEQLRLIEQLDERLSVLARDRLSAKSSALGWLMGKGRTKHEPAKGLYIWGGVGRGKSMLMDLFFEQLPHKRKQRVHFNDFMQNAQEQIHLHRKAFKAGDVSEEDPIPPVGKALAANISVLCFDEFAVTDIADAMILGRLFQVLFARGVTVIATSNVEPINLYKDGLNRKIFLPFIDLLLEHVDVFELKSRTDFRLEKLNRSPVYLSPVTKSNLMLFEEGWQRMVGADEGKPVTLQLKGRQLHISQTGNRAARFTFKQLCEEPRSAEDYLAVARKFHTIFIENIPVMEKEHANAAKRFILLIDTLYDNRVKLVALAEASPEKLYLGKTGTEAFEFDRTVSRLVEMQSEDYIGDK